ncbi:unnamed protein product [Cuscuta campestris]|uniref:DNA-directed DNA polymerase n=1 Tax=Cuscuta campestris TaxID=132261 RepID=A0A484M9H8_9ASTE|nr:unnamed protein product [Cuscuta campestris]
MDSTRTHAAALDFASICPSLMKVHNLCYCTLVTSGSDYFMFGSMRVRVENYMFITIIIRVHAESSLLAEAWRYFQQYGNFNASTDQHNGNFTMYWSKLVILKTALSNLGAAVFILFQCIPELKHYAPSVPIDVVGTRLGEKYLISDRNMVTS